MTATARRHRHRDGAEASGDESARPAAAAILKQRQRPRLGPSRSTAAVVTASAALPPLPAHFGHQRSAGGRWHGITALRQRRHTAAAVAAAATAAGVAATPLPQPQPPVPSPVPCRRRQHGTTALSQRGHGNRALFRRRRLGRVSDGDCQSLGHRTDSSAAPSSSVCVATAGRRRYGGAAVEATPSPVGLPLPVAAAMRPLAAPTGVLSKAARRGCDSHGLAVATSTLLCSLPPRSAGPPSQQWCAAADN